MSNMKLMNSFFFFIYFYSTLSRKGKDGNHCQQYNSKNKKSNKLLKCYFGYGFLWDIVEHNLHCNDN